MKKEGRSRSSLIRWAGTLIALVLIVLLISRQGWGEIWGAVVEIGWPRFLLALAVLMVSRFMVAARWHVLLRAAEMEIKYKDSLRITFVGLFASNFLPSTVGGDVVRLAGVVQAGYDAAVGAASLVVDRLVGMFGMALVLPPGLAKLFAFQGSQTVISLAWVGKLSEKFKTFVGRIWQAMKLWAKHPLGLLSSLFFTGMHMLMLYLCIQVYLNAMGESVSLWLIAGLWSLVYFVTLVPVSINGLGVQELSIAFAFSELGGVSEQNALTLALLIRTVFMLASLPGALYVRQLLPKE